MHSAIRSSAPQPVDGHARRLNRLRRRIDWIKIDLGGQFVQFGLKGEPYVDRAVTAHGATRGLVRQHRVAVIWNVADIVERPQQSPGIQIVTTP